MESAPEKEGKIARLARCLVAEVKKHDSEEKGACRKK